MKKETLLKIAALLRAPETEREKYARLFSDASKIAFLPVDFHSPFTFLGHAAAAARRAQAATKAFREAGVRICPVLLMRSRRLSETSTDPDDACEIERRPGDMVIVKRELSALDGYVASGDNLTAVRAQDALHDGGYATLLVGGISTGACVITTVMHALRHYFNVCVMPDLVSTGLETGQQHIEKMSKAGALDLESKDVLRYIHALKRPR